MNAVASVAESSDAPLMHAPRSAATHIRLALLGVIAHLVESHDDVDLDATFKAHPFLADYYVEIARLLGVPLNDEWTSLAAQWREALARWERTASQPLPLCQLSAAGLDALEIELLLAVGLIEEDPKFGGVFERASVRERRATVAVLLAWWRTDAAGEDRLDAVREAIARLIGLGLLSVADSSAPRPEWALTVPAPVWDALYGKPLRHASLRFIPREALLPFDRYLLADDACATCRALPAMLGEESRQLVVLRGPRHNGRKTLAGAIAHAAGKALLVASEAAVQDPTQWRQFLLLALLANAFPVIELELALGATRTLPEIPLYDGPIFVVTGLSGSVCCADARPLLNIVVPLPQAEHRSLHWRSELPRQTEAALALTDSLRLTSGNIRRAARSAANLARISRRVEVQPGDVKAACRALQADRLETLAQRLSTDGDLSDLAVDEPTREELNALLTRCRFREPLSERGPQFARVGVGVRALFAGASGTGKTLAARLLAATLDRDLYRIDLAATVNKYIGETEKNLDRALAAAEELDVVVLLDEGDALMAARTDVSSANDRYANLETNFLLQRIESFSGILVVTTNAADRIDKAFSRRMDVVIHFRPPDEWSRYEILKAHLGSQSVSDEWLQEIAYRCALSGGQLRNVATHAALLALQAESDVTDAHLYAALAREYRKTGGACPLRRPRAAES